MRVRLNLFQEQDVAFSAGKAQTCPASMPLQYIEHSLDGYNATKGQANSATYEFDWTPPATDVGQYPDLRGGKRGERRSHAKRRSHLYSGPTL